MSTFSQIKQLLQVSEEDLTEQNVFNKCKKSLIELIKTPEELIMVSDTLYTKQLKKPFLMKLCKNIFNKKIASFFSSLKYDTSSIFDNDKDLSYLKLMVEMNFLSLTDSNSQLVTQQLNNSPEIYFDNVIKFNPIIHKQLKKPYQALLYCSQFLNDNDYDKFLKPAFFSTGLSLNDISSLFQFMSRDFKENKMVEFFEQDSTILDHVLSELSNQTLTIKTDHYPVLSLIQNTNIIRLKPLMCQKLWDSFEIFSSNNSINIDNMVLYCFNINPHGMTNISNEKLIQKLIIETCQNINLYSHHRKSEYKNNIFDNSMFLVEKLSFFETYLKDNNISLNQAFDKTLEKVKNMMIANYGNLQMKVNYRQLSDEDYSYIPTSIGYDTSLIEQLYNGYSLIKPQLEYMDFNKYLETKKSTSIKHKL